MKIHRPQKSLQEDLLSFSSACSVAGNTSTNKDTCIVDGSEIINQETVLVSQETAEIADEEEKVTTIKRTLRPKSRLTWRKVLLLITQ